MASWAFLKDGAGILPASNMADTLGGSDLTATDVLVREAVQNSLDERRSDIQRPVKIRFELRTLTGDDKMRFVQNLRLHELSDRRRSFTQSHNWIIDGNRILDTIDDPTVAFPILVISDFNANGLGGHWNRRRSNEDRFFNLVLSIGGSLKWEDENADAVRKLGSYGYGKMAFAMCSDIRVVAYYSTFHANHGSNGTRCRAMATGFLPPHTRDDIDYAGQAYFGDDSGDERIPRKPLVDVDAHEWIRSLGLPQRQEEDTGVTIVIPATRSSIGEIIECCEKWWWPRMRDPEPLRQVMFEFIEDDKPLRKCRPRVHPGLSHFMDCFKLITSGMPGDGYKDYDVVVIPEGRRRAAGRLVLKALQTSTDARDASEKFTNCVALVRDGLVIKYESRFAHEDKHPVAGVFVPDADFETHQALVLSEPPSHDDWIENADRLRGEYIWGREFIRLMKNRIRNQTRDFQTSQDLHTESESTSSAAFLRKTLGRIFGPSKNRTPRPPVPPRPQRRAFTIGTRESGRRLRPNGPGQEDFAVFRIGLSEHAPKESVTVEVVVSLKALADVDASPTDAVPCEVTTPDGTHCGKERVTFTTELRADRDIAIEARGKVHSHWKTQWEISISRQE